MCLRSDLLRLILTERLHGLAHTDRDHKSGGDRDEVENAKNGQEPLAHHVSQGSEDYQQDNHDERPSAQRGQKIGVRLGFAGSCRQPA